MECMQDKLIRTLIDYRQRNQHMCYAVQRLEVISLVAYKKKMALIILI